jgi:hypothetical protein
MAQLRRVGVSSARPVVGVHRTSAARARKDESDPLRTLLVRAFEWKRCTLGPL